jgi:glycyl-tRNA synthetase
VKQNLIALWRKHFVIEENLMEVDDTNIMPHDVLFTSGHVERFNDFIVKDSSDAARFYRADKLLEEVMEARMAAAGVTPEQKIEFEKVKAQADAYSKEQIWAVFQQYAIKAPETGADLTEPEEFNLMFGTPIGPTGLIHGYLRPETAQGIFINFKFCLEQNAGVVPFGIAQVGKAFRNEIAPRSGLIRQREFTQAEIEFFVHPQKKAHPKFGDISGLELQLFASPQQLAAEPATRMTLGAAVAAGTVANETLAFFIARTYLFLVRAGCRAEHIRFRQHLPDEMAHYACDCWDAEIEMSLGWVECVGIADRSAFDLTVHSEATGVSLTAQQNLDTPITVERFGLANKSGAAIGKSFKKDAKLVTGALAALSPDELKALKATAEANGSCTVEADGRSFEISNELLELQSVIETKHVEVFTPNVIEPSFGIDRILTAIYEHTFSVRAEEAAPAEDKKKGGKAEGDKAKAGVLSLPAEIAPYKCVVLPLDQRVTSKYTSLLAALRIGLADHALQYKLDESSASIGRRYARADELGIPYAITIDFDSVEEGPLAGTATVRERDSTLQARLPLADIPGVIAKLVAARSLSWEEVLAAYSAGSASSSAASASGSGDKLDYLRTHDVAATLNDAVNALAEAKPDDPIAWLSARLASLKQ